MATSCPELNFSGHSHLNIRIMSKMCIEDNLSQGIIIGEREKKERHTGRL
jgi:hypothetical protein